MGGGVSGEVGFPRYIEEAHEILLDTATQWRTIPAGNRVAGALATALNLSNPFSTTALNFQNYNPENITSTGIVKFPDVDTAVTDAYDDLPDVVRSVRPLAENLWGILSSRSSDLNDPVEIPKFRPEEFASIGIGFGNQVKDAVLANALSDAVEANSTLNDLISSFTTRQESARDVAYGRIDNQASLVGAANSSAPVFAKALIQKDVTDSIADFSARVHQEFIQVAVSVLASTYTRVMETMVAQGIGGAIDKTRLEAQQASAIRQAKIQAVAIQAQYASALIPHQFDKFQADMQVQQIKLAGLQLLSDTRRLRYALSDDWYKTKTDVEVQRIYHPLKILEAGTNIISKPIGGATFIPPTVSRASSSISGFLGGAAAGASSVATAGGPAAIGTPAGLAITGAAALLGGFAGFLQ